MAFELRTRDRVPATIRKIVAKRIDDVLSMSNGSKRTGTSDRVVHEVRKRFKEIRGTLRLVREELGEATFRRENRTFRDAGRPLSAVRDASVLVDTLDRLVEHFDGRVSGKAFAPVRRILLARRREAKKRVLKQDRTLLEINKSMRAARKRVKDWPLTTRGWKAIEGGLRRVYAQGRRALTDAQKDPSDDEGLHEWRKRAKDLRYELELLQPVWEQMIRPLSEQAHRLTDLLGDDHDLSVLRGVARDEIGAASNVDAELLFALVDERRAAVQHEAFELGRKLYEESPRKFVQRLEGYWQAARGA